MSAKIFLEEAQQPNKDRSNLYTVKPIPITLEDDVITIAFVLPHILRQYSGQIQKLVLDSVLLALLACCQNTPLYPAANPRIL